MLYGLMLSFFVVMCFFLILIILIQQGKGNMGFGSMGGATQMIFGGSGGQDIFQKITWVLGALLMGGSLFLSIMKSTQFGTLPFAKRPVAEQHAPAEQEPVESQELPQAE